MENSRYMLAAMAAFSLIMSVVSGVNPSYFAGQNAFADDEDEFVESLGEHSKATLETDDGEVDLEIKIEDGDLENGEYNVMFTCDSPDIDEVFNSALEVEEGEGDFEAELDLEEGEYSGCEVSVGDLSASFPAFAVLAHEEDDEDETEDEEHEEDDDNKGGPDREERKDKHNIVQSLGNNSKATLQIDDDEAELEVEIEDGDLDDETYDVMFACDSPDIDEEFAGALEIEDGEGEFETELALSNGTYAGCEVDVGGLSASFPSFTIMSHEGDDEEHDEEDEHKRGHGHEAKFESKLKAEDDRVEIEVEVEGLDMTDGSYDAVFACEDPDFSLTLEDAFEVEDGEGEFEAEIGLANGTYSDCDITIEGTVLASFDTFTVSEETEDEQERKVEQKRKEKRERIVTTINGITIHEKHRSQNAASPGEYQPGWNYTLMANGTAMQRAGNETDNEADAEVLVDMAIWKSNRAIVLLDVINGTVHVDNQTYTVVLGYAIHVIQHDTIRVAALAVDDDGNIFKLKLRGSASDDAEFPMESGSIDLTFEGSSSPHNRLGEWNLMLEGTIQAG
jgi:hypothetical protein